MLQTGVLYRVGKGGVRVTWRDGSTSRFRLGARLRFIRPPLRIEGRLYLVGSRSLDTFEAPALTPHR